MEKKQKEPKKPKLTWDYIALPAYEDIHPNMPEQLQERLAHACKTFGISFWDREKLYNQLRKGIQ